LTAVYL